MNYDVFLSHSHVDKAWTRQLYDRLATTDYNGRRLRAWLDQEVLDPGNLSSSRELESALDRSRFLAVVLTPESVASHWVRHEIDYFVGSKQPESTAVIRRRACKIPQALADAEMIEWIDKDDDQQNQDRLLNFLRLKTGDQYFEYNHRRSVRRAWTSALYSQPEGFDPMPTEENSELLQLLLSYKIHDPSRIDLSTMAAILRNLDQLPALAGHETSVAVMVGRTLGKFRGTELVDLLIHTLVHWGGRASHVAAATAIAANYDSDDALVYYTNELAKLAPDPEDRPSFPRPSESIARLLLDTTSRLWMATEVHDHILFSRDDFIASFGSDWPLGSGLWPQLSYAPGRRNMPSPAPAGRVSFPRA